MANAKFSIGQVNITDYLRVIAREVTNPTAEVANILYAPPQPTSRNIVITGLNPVMHYFDFYETPGPSTQGTLLATFTIDVGLINQTAIEFIEFDVDGGVTYDDGSTDPASQTDTYTNTTLDGAEYQVSQRGIGPRSFVNEIQHVAGGGFKLLNGEKFNSQDKWFIIVAKTVTTHATIISRGMFTDVIEVYADKTLSSTDFNTMQEANCSSLVLTITFPALSTIPDDTIFGFNTHFGAQRYLAVQLQSGETIRLMGGLKNIFWLGKCETITITKKGALLKVLEDGTQYKDVGKKVKGDLPPINGLAETGGWHNMADYPRFFYEYVNLVPAGNLATVSDVNANVLGARQKFSIDNTLHKFWMRDTGGFFERNVDPNGDLDSDRDSSHRYAGVRQEGMTKWHSHAAPFGESHDDPFGSANLPTKNKIGSNATDFDNDIFYTNDGSEVAGAQNPLNAPGDLGHEGRPVNVSEFSYRII